MGYRRSWEAKYLAQPFAGGLKRAPHLGTPKAPLEKHEQITLAAYLDRIGVLWCHVPNGGSRDRREAQMFKAQGVKQGVPDNLIFTQPPISQEQLYDVCCSGVRARGLLAAFTPWQGARVVPEGHLLPKACGVAIELKREGATLSLISPEQIAWGEELARRGWYWFVARGAGEAIDELKRLGYSKF